MNKTVEKLEIYWNERRSGKTELEAKLTEEAKAKEHARQEEHLAWKAGYGSQETQYFAIEFRGASSQTVQEK